jgi:hypothetical protein
MGDLIAQDVFDRLPEKFRIRARQIAERVAEIDRLLQPCTIDSIREAGRRLHGQLRPQPDIDVEDYAREFKIACADLPDWAVSEATNDFLAGRVENHTGQFMPTCAEFARHARSIISPFVVERSIIRREAQSLFSRAEDQRRRDIIALERQDPKQLERIRKLKENALKGAPKTIAAAPHSRLDPETQARLDALKLSRPEPGSKIPQTKVGRAG